MERHYADLAGKKFFPGLINYMVSGPAVEYFLVVDTTQEEVCRIFKCFRRSIMRWVEKYTNDGEITGYDRKPIATKNHKEHIDFLLNEIKQRKTITMEDLLVKLKEKYPDADITRRHLSRVVRDNNITLKITRVRHEPNKRFGKDIDITPTKEKNETKLLQKINLSVISVRCRL